MENNISITEMKNNNRNPSHRNNEDLTSILDGENLNMGGIPTSHESLLDDLLQDTHQNKFPHSQTQMLFPLNNNEEKNKYHDDSIQVEKNNKKRVRRERRDNNEAVRRYYQKLKVREAELEDEVKKLKVLNQELMKRLEGEAAMHEEITLLKCLLVDLRGRIEGEVSSFRHNEPSNNAWFNGCDCGIDRVLSIGLNEEFNSTSSTL